MVILIRVIASFLFLASTIGYKCESDGLFEDESDCQMYYECVWMNTEFAKVEHLKCPDGLVYYPSRHRCVELEELELQFENGLKTPQDLFEFIQFKKCLNKNEENVDKQPELNTFLNSTEKKENFTTHGFNGVFKNSRLLKQLNVSRWKKLSDNKINLVFLKNSVINQITTPRKRRLLLLQNELNSTNLTNSSLEYLNKSESVNNTLNNFTSLINHNLTETYQELQNESKIESSLNNSMVSHNFTNFTTKTPISMYFNTSTKLSFNVTKNYLFTYKQNASETFSPLKLDNGRGILRANHSEKLAFLRSTSASSPDNLIECKENDFGLECSCSMTLSPPKCKQLINSFLNSCKVHGCKNNGKCIKMPSKNTIPYVCSCASDFIGSFCEEERLSKDKEDDQLLLRKQISNINNPFISPQMKNFNFIQKISETNVDFSEPLCEPNPCMNNAQCLIIGDLIQCKCVNSSFSGKYCEHTERPKAATKHTIETINKKKFNGNEELLRLQCPSSCFKSLGQGVCALSSGGYAQCVCTKPWTGVDCSKRDVCAENHCLNNSTCVSYPEMKSYVCQCLKGFVGRACEIPLLTNSAKTFFQQKQSETTEKTTRTENSLVFQNPCIDGICQNNGTCIISYSTEINKFRVFCRCKSGFYGEFCEKRANPCDPNPCNFPTPFCISERDNTFRCVCVSNCSTNLNEIEKPRSTSVLTNPCSDSNICLTQPHGNASFICVRNLLTKDYTECVLTKSINCRESSPCLNGGVCVENEDVGWRCDCTAGFFGRLCETELCAPVHRLFANHTMCLPDSPNLTDQGVDHSQIQLIIDAHNSLRRQVQPSAANMQKMYWDVRLEQLAQKRAQLCSVQNYGILMRQQPGYGVVVGENLAAGYEQWEQVLNSWMNGGKNFVYKSNSSSDNQQSGHYTQMIYSQAARIGCGFAECLNTQYQTFFVCYYGEMFLEKN